MAISAATAPMTKSGRPESAAVMHHDHHRRAVDAQGAHHEREQRVLPVDAGLLHTVDVDVGGRRAAERGGEVDPGALQVEVELIGSRNLMAEAVERELVGVGDRPDAQDFDDDDRREPAAVGGLEPVEDVA